MHLLRVSGGTSGLSWVGLREGQRGDSNSGGVSKALPVGKGGTVFQRGASNTLFDKWYLGDGILTPAFLNLGNIPGVRQRAYLLLCLSKRVICWLQVCALRSVVFLKKNVKPGRIYGVESREMGAAGSLS